MTTYLNDDSFFTTVFPLFAMGCGTAVKVWFDLHNRTRFRFIRDSEAESHFFNLEQVDDLYPGIRTISIIANPWARMRYAYVTLMTNDIVRKIYPFETDLSSFDAFINKLPHIPPIQGAWFTPATPTVRWSECVVDGTYKRADYILRAEHIEEDFKPIQEYFCTNEPLVLSEPYPKYKTHYNDSTKAIVAQLFKEDIDRFGYEF